LPPSAAEFYIEPAIDSLILLRKINESIAGSNDYLARSAEKILFTQPQKNLPSPQAALSHYLHILHNRQRFFPAFR
jgi:hypothetical protein